MKSAETHKGQNSGMNTMQHTRIIAEIPRPGLKKSMNLRFPGLTTRVLVPDPTGVRKGA